MIGLASETKHTKLGYPVTRENGNEGLLLRASSVDRPMMRRSRLISSLIIKTFKEKTCDLMINKHLHGLILYHVTDLLLLPTPNISNSRKQAIQ